MHLFVYGTLMDAEIMSHVAGGHFVSRPARLEGYRRRRMRGEVYPAIVPCPDETVAGRVYFSLPPAALERLDQFEGRQYERCLVTVACADGPLQVQAYVLAPAYHDRLSSASWELTTFQRSGKVRFSRHYTGFERVRDGGQTGGN
jgi:gamma-glutamylcyclotransferase (GGCT)/AIG2-like uncharacterized protein YtfP